MSQLESFLEKKGLTNKDSESWGIIASAPPVKLEAYCSSNRCVNRGCYPVKKELYGAKPDICPDCGHALVWKRQRRACAGIGS